MEKEPMRDRARARHLVFAFLSASYGSAIFLMADSPLAMSLSAFNPNSILHIPLYGILSLLLLFSIPPHKKRPFETARQGRDLAGSDSPGLWGEPDPMESPSTGGRNRSHRRRMWIAGLFAFAVAVADEIHQSRIPGREASLSDIVLDVLGIVLAFGVIHWLRRRKVSWLES